MVFAARQRRRSQRQRHFCVPKQPHESPHFCTPSKSVPPLSAGNKAPCLEQFVSQAGLSNDAGAVCSPFISTINDPAQRNSQHWAPLFSNRFFFSSFLVYTRSKLIPPLQESKIAVIAFPSSCLLQVFQLPSPAVTWLEPPPSGSLAGDTRCWQFLLLSSSHRHKEKFSFGEILHQQQPELRRAIFERRAGGEGSKAAFAHQIQI